MNIIILFILVKLFHLYSILKLKRSNEIYDLGHRVLPVLPSCFKIVPDMIVAILFLWSVILYRQNVTPLFTAYITVTLLRVVCMHMTVLPPEKSYECTNRHPVGCTQDYMFSGHTSMAVMSLLFIAAVSDKTLYVPLTLIGLVQMLTIISLRNHYTIDVFLGTLLSFFVFCTNK